MDLNVQFSTILFVFICPNVYTCVLCTFVLFCVHLRIIRSLCVVFCMRCVISSGWQVPKTHFKNRILNPFMLCLFACIYSYPSLSIYVCSLCMWCVFVTCQCVSMSHTPKTDLTTIEMSFEMVYVWTKIHVNLMLN